MTKRMVHSELKHSFKLTTFQLKRAAGVKDVKKDSQEFHKVFEIIGSQISKNLNMRNPLSHKK